MRWYIFVDPYNLEPSRYNLDLLPPIQPGLYFSFEDNKRRNVRRKSYTTSVSVAPPLSSMPVPPTLHIVSYGDASRMNMNAADRFSDIDCVVGEYTLYSTVLTNTSGLISMCMSCWGHASYSVLSSSHPREQCVCSEVYTTLKYVVLLYHSLCTTYIGGSQFIMKLHDSRIHLYRSSHYFQTLKQVCMLLVLY